MYSLANNWILVSDKVQIYIAETPIDTNTGGGVMQILVNIQLAKELVGLHKQYKAAAICSNSLKVSDTMIQKPRKPINCKEKTQLWNSKQSKE